MPSESTFDLDALVGQSTSAAGQTSLPMPDEGEYRAVIDDAPDGTTKWFRQVETKNGPRLILRIPFVIQDPAVGQKLGREKVVVSKDCWVDVADDGSIDWSKGRNLDINRVRDAVGLNRDGVAFSLASLPNAGPCLIRVIKRPIEGRDEPVTEVSRTVPLAV